jgi:hypothetical protein
MSANQTQERLLSSSTAQAPTVLCVLWASTCLALVRLSGISIFFFNNSIYTEYSELIKASS